MVSPLSVKIIGVHRFIPTVAVFNDTLEALYGGKRSASDLAAAKSMVKEHFDGLYAIEIEVEPSVDGFDWSEVTQSIAGYPRSNWQVPYDAQPLGDEGKRWAFFFHFLNLHQPLLTPCGALQLPPVTPLPEYLKGIEYFAP